MDPASTLTIKRVPLSGLNLDPANARSHGERNLDAIRASLASFGQAEPLIIQARSQRVIGGNGRLVAMRALGRREAQSAPATPATTWSTTATPLSSAAARRRARSTARRRGW